jgi:hypothetical protein
MSGTKLTAEEAYSKRSLLIGKRVYDKKTGEEFGILTKINPGSKKQLNGVEEIEDYIFRFNERVNKRIYPNQMLEFEDHAATDGTGISPTTVTVTGGKKRKQSKRKQSKRKQSKRKQSRKSRR